MASGKGDADKSSTQDKGGYDRSYLLWMDPVTKVGLLEPMHTEVGFQRMGLGSALVGEGLRRR